MEKSYMLVIDSRKVEITVIKKKILLVMLSAASLSMIPGRGVEAGQKEQIYLELSVGDLAAADNYGRVQAGNEHNIWLPVLAIIAGTILLLKKNEQKAKGGKNVRAETTDT